MCNIFVRRIGPTAVALSAIVLALAGCGGSATPTKQTASPGASAESKSGAAAKQRKSTAEADVPENAYASLDEAVEALTKAAEASDTPGFIRAETWLVKKGDAAVEPLARILNDQQAEISQRIAVCRTLRRLGPAAKPPLTKALEDPSTQIQLNAIKGLGLLRPTDEDIVRRLDQLVDSGEDRVRLEAILALGNIGAPAKEACADKFITILNDMDENETIRDAAKRALQEINPRRSFVDR
jgi:HEAT repeat protein